MGRIKKQWISQVIFGLCIIQSFVLNSYAASMYIDVLDLKQMDVADVLKLLSQKSGLNMVAQKEVRGQVSIYLKDVDVLEALTLIVESNGWAYVKESNTIKVLTDSEYEKRYGYRFGREVQTRVHQLQYVNTAGILTVLNQLKGSSGKIISEENSAILVLIDEPQILDQMEEIIRRIDIPTKTEIFSLNYAQAGQLSTKISKVLTPSLGQMELDERSNKIIVTDTLRKLKEIGRLVEAFDQKDKEVLIEAKIIQVVLSDEHKMGVDWEAVVKDFHNLHLRNNFNVLGPTTKSGRLSIGTLANDNYSALFEALETIGTTDILSSPRITTLNRKEARILVGSTEPYVTTTTTTPASGPAVVAESVKFIEVGVKLFVTPTIHNDGFITMKIKPEVSSVTSNLTTSNNNTIPIVETSEAETTVNVKDGVTVIIGGLIKEETINTTKQIPFLGKIPVLGMIFRSTNNSTSKTEIVIFLTPHIVTGDVEDNEYLAAF